MERVSIRVLQFGEDGKEKVLYRNTVFLSPSLVFDFNAVYRVLKCLYPNARLIDFNCSD